MIPTSVLGMLCDQCLARAGLRQAGPLIRAGSACMTNRLEQLVAPTGRWAQSGLKFRVSCIITRVWEAGSGILVLINFAEVQVFQLSPLLLSYGLYFLRPFVVLSFGKSLDESTFLFSSWAGFSPSQGIGCTIPSRTAICSSVRFCSIKTFF